VFWHPVSVMSDKSRPQIPAADQTLRILSLLARQPGPMAAQSIATALEIPRSSTYHLLATLEQHGYVVHLPGDRRWGLGTSAFELGGGYARQQPLARLGRPLIAGLSDRVGESAHLAVLVGRDVLYIVDERAPRRPVLVTDVGVRLPAHLTATGRAMLAALPREQVRALFPDATALTQRHGLGPATPRDLREVLREVRVAGHASENGEVTPGFRSVAAAVLDHAGWPAAAVAITWPADGPERDAEVLASAACATAAELARRIGRHA